MKVSRNMVNTSYILMMILDIHILLVNDDCIFLRMIYLCNIVLQSAWWSLNSISELFNTQIFNINLLDHLLKLTRTNIWSSDVPSKVLKNMQTVNGDAILGAETNLQWFHEPTVLRIITISTWRSRQHCTLQHNL